MRAIIVTGYRGYTSLALRSDAFIVMKRVGILYHPMIEAAYALAKKLEEFLGSSGLSVWLCSACKGRQPRLR